MILDEMFLAPTPEQLKHLDAEYGLDMLKHLDVLRHCGVWGLMLVLRPPQKQGAKETKARSRTRPREGRWGSSS